ncbi:Alpha/Beta hydrolase protein [Hysterangium stoloniferum]|nr:Alpha/Beta hydrolase protein [Hysterangium stoloniferum]
MPSLWDRLRMRIRSLNLQRRNPFALGIQEIHAGDSPTVDVVLVHGLDGHPINSWTTDDICWPRDLLPRLIQHARVLSYGYGVQDSKNALAEQLLEHYATNLIASLAEHRSNTETTERPIIFVVHSMGGIVLKAALVHASKATEDQLFSHKQIYISTYGIVYLGTPHQGIDIAKMATQLINVAAIFTSINTKFLRYLEAHSEKLQTLQAEYNLISTDFVTKYAYELYTTRHKTGIEMWASIVPKASAVVPGAVNAESTGINADHINISKFSSDTDDGYITISGWLKDMADAAPAAI